MGKNYRIRVNRKGATTIGKGHSSSQNAAVTSFRDAAKAQRLAHHEPLVAIDERVEQEASNDPVAQLGLVSSLLGFHLYIIFFHILE